MFIKQKVSAEQDLRLTRDAIWAEKILEDFSHNIVKNVLITIQDRDEVTIDDVTKEVDKEITTKKVVESRLGNCL